MTGDKEYLDLFKPRSDQPAGNDEPDQTASGSDVASDFTQEAWDTPVEPLSPEPAGPSFNLRDVRVLLGGGCALLVLLAFFCFVIYWIFLRGNGDGEPQATRPPTSTPTQVFLATPTIDRVPVESPIAIPVVSSDDVRVPVALPEHLSIGQSVFEVQGVNAPAGAWPDAPASGETVNWAYGTVVNYVLALAATPENADLLNTVQDGDPVSLQMSTGRRLIFNVDQVATEALDEAGLFDQVAPRLTLALLSGDGSAPTTVMTASFFDDGAGDEDSLSQAVSGGIGTPIERGPVIVNLIDAYQVAAGEAGLPPGTGYFLVDLAVQNVGTQPLETAYFQTFIRDEDGQQYPLTHLAEQFAHHGTPTEPLNPGETLIGSLGYLVPDVPGGQVQWVFNPLPGSDNWMTVWVPYSLPAPPSTPTPPPAVGFAVVSINTDDVFVDAGRDMLSVGLSIQNVSEVAVEVTEADILMSSTDGEADLDSTAPLLPWIVEPGQYRMFELQFELPSADNAILTVLGYTFLINNLGGQ